MDGPINQNITIHMIIQGIRNNLFEITFLLIFLGFLLKFSSVLSGQLLVHESPYQFVAGDMFWLTAEGLGIMNTDDISVRSPLLMKGDVGVYNNYPFILPMIIAELSFFTGFESYDILSHLVVFFILSIIICLYFILRQIHPFVAIAGTPLVLFMYKWPFNYVLTWGAQMSDTNMFLIFFAVLAFIFLDVKYMFILLGIINAAGIFAHARESLMFNIGILLFFAVQIITRQFNKTLFWKYILSAILTTVILISWLPVMHDIFGIYSGGSTFIQFCPANPESNHVVFLKDFGFFQWLLFPGILISIALLFLLKSSWQKKLCIAMFISFLINSYFCFLGNKSTQIRHFFPITLALFIGLLIWTIITNIPALSKNIKAGLVLVWSLVFMVLLLTYFFPAPVPEYAVSNPLTHSAFKWVESNLKSDENILYLYGDNHYQYTLFFLPMTLHDSIEQNDFFETIQKDGLTSRFKVIRGSLGFYVRRTSFFNLDSYGVGFFENKTLCDYNYVYFNKISQQPIIAKYLADIKAILINEFNFNEVYTNQLVTILKNPSVGGVCFESRKFNANA